MLPCVHSKAPPGPKSGEARINHHSDSGPSSNDKQHEDHSQSSSRIQVIAERMTAFKRMESAFGKVGWSFYPLTDESFLAVHRRWQMSHVCPDLRAAGALLRRIGGGV